MRTPGPGSFMLRSEAFQARLISLHIGLQLVVEVRHAGIVLRCNKPAPAGDTE